jgi:hypothetical protein
MQITNAKFVQIIPKVPEYKDEVLSSRKENNSGREKHFPGNNIFRATTPHTTEFPSL